MNANDQRPASMEIRNNCQRERSSATQDWSMKMSLCPQCRQKDSLVTAALNKKKTK